jgi:hypothetical protein
VVVVKVADLIADASTNADVAFIITVVVVPTTTATAAAPVAEVTGPSKAGDQARLLRRIEGGGSMDLHPIVTAATSRRQDTNGTSNREPVLKPAQRQVFVHQLDLHQVDINVQSTFENRVHAAIAAQATTITAEVTIALGVVD